MSVPHVLVVEDNPADADLIREQLLDVSMPDSCTVDHVSCLADALVRLDQRTADLVLLDLGLPDSHGLDTVRKAVIAAGDVPVVVLSGVEDEDTLYEAMQARADDFLVKGLVDRRQLLRTLARASVGKREHSGTISPDEILASSESILIADRDPARMLTMHMMLRMHCFPTVTAAVDDLPDLAVRTKPRLILVGLGDSDDPELLDVLERLRHTGPPVVAVVPPDRVVLEEKAMETGITGVLRAPIRYKQLGDWVESIASDLSVTS